MVARFLVACLTALVVVPVALAQAPPQNLRAFALTATEPQASERMFARTPSFAWAPVRGAKRYELQLSSSRSFSENAVVWASEKLPSPVATVPLTLPWTTGAPFSFFARVRAHVGRATTRWSAPYGFRVRAPQAPASLSSGTNPTPGMVRWTPVDGATAYEVTFTYSLERGEKKLVKTATTAADLREHYTFHDWVPASVPTQWRVRAVRELDGKALNGLPSVSYGPWSSVHTTYEPPPGPGVVRPLQAISRSGPADVVSTSAGAGAGPHELMPGFRWAGRANLAGASECPWLPADVDVTCPLFHVYVFTDEDCVNRVHVSDLVGSPAYVPRLTLPLDLPKDRAKLRELVTDDHWVYLGDGEEGRVFDAGGTRVHAAGLDPDLPAPSDKAPDRRTGLWDSDWPDSRYYWTAVPAVPRVTLGGDVEYHDIEFAEEMCRAGRLVPFGKTSAPVIERANGVPYLSGMNAAGAIASAASDRPRFFGRVVAAWKPAPGASRYQVQWSRTAYPFRPAGTLTTPATAAELALPTGVWHYRVRGLDRTIPGRLQGMTWSDPQHVRVVPRSFAVVKRR